jgi:hypothetical protein
MPRTEPFLGVGQHDGECRAFGVFEFDSDCSASAVGQADVGDDGCAQLVAAFGARGPARVDHVARGGLIVVRVGAGPIISVCPSARTATAKGKRSPCFSSLRLGEAEGRLQQPVEVVLRLG